MGASFLKGLFEILKAKGFRIGSGLVGGSSVFLVVIYLHQDISQKIDKLEASQKEHLALKIEPIKEHVLDLRIETRELKTLVGNTCRPRKRKD